MPGNTLFLPPEKPAKKCGSMKPSEINSSVSTANLLMMQSPPDGNTPIFVIWLASPEIWFTIFSLATISGPNLSTISSCVVGRWKPVASKIVISMDGLASRIRRSRIGIVILLGTGRVWSLVMMTMLDLPLTNSSKRWLPIGLSSACSTNASCESSAL